MRQNTLWLGSISAGESYEISPIEQRLHRIDVIRQPRWDFLYCTTYSPLGQAISFACGHAPPIYELRPVMAEFVDASTDDELQAFVTVMGLEARRNSKKQLLQPATKLC